MDTERESDRFRRAHTGIHAHMHTNLKLSKLDMVVNRGDFRKCLRVAHTDAFENLYMYER